MLLVSVFKFTVLGLCLLFFLFKYCCDIASMCDASSAVRSLLLYLCPLKHLSNCCVTVAAVMVQNFISNVLSFVFAYSLFNRVKLPGKRLKFPVYFVSYKIFSLNFNWRINYCTSCNREKWSCTSISVEFSYKFKNNRTKFNRDHFISILLLYLEFTFWNFIEFYHHSRHLWDSFLIFFQYIFKQILTQNNFTHTQKIQSD